MPPLVRTVPRRGTHVVGQSLDVIADLFNMRAVLVGLASRYVARRRDPAVIASLQAQVDALSAAVERPGVTPLAFARMGGDTAAVIVRHCGASWLVQMLTDHAHHSGWGMIWRKRALDFKTPLAPALRPAITRLVALIARRRADAERLLRQMMFESRDRVLAAIAEARGGQSIRCTDSTTQPTRAGPLLLPLITGDRDGRCPARAQRRRAAVLSINRPERRNALNSRCSTAWSGPAQARRRRHVAAVLLRGEGPAFCVGGDVKGMAEGAGRELTLEQRMRGLRARMEGARLLHTISKPTIAAVHGAVAGAGLAIALACDFRSWRARPRSPPRSRKLAFRETSAAAGS